MKSLPYMFSLTSFLLNLKRLASIGLLGKLDCARLLHPSCQYFLSKASNASSYSRKMQFYCCSLNTAFEWKNMELSCNSKCMSNHFCALLIFSSERFASLFVICFASQLSCVVVLTLPTKHHKKCQSVAIFWKTTFSKITLLSLTLSFFSKRK